MASLIYMPLNFINFLLRMFFSFIMSAGFLTPLTDLGVMTSSRSLLGSNNPLCSQIQLDFNDCLEAYGYQRAREKCEKFYIDLMECWTFRKQVIFYC